MLTGRHGEQATRAHAASCQYFGGRLVPVGARERRLTNCLEGSRLTHRERDCLITTVSTTFGALVGLLIPGESAVAIARAVVSGGAGACLHIILEDT